jgi:hypothetical protein
MAAFNLQLSLRVPSGLPPVLRIYTSSARPPNPARMAAPASPVGLRNQPCPSLWCDPRLPHQ